MQTLTNSLTLLCGLFLLSPTSFAKSAKKNPPQEVAQTDGDKLAKLQEQLGSSQYLTLNFKSTYFKKSIRKKTAFTATSTLGTAYFAKPSLFRWDIENKASQLVFDGKSFFQYYPKTKSATELKNAKEFLNITEIFLNFEKLKQSYNIDSVKEEGSDTYLALTPKNNQEITKVEVVVDGKELFVKELKLYYPSDERTEISFFTPKREVIETATFQLPSGTEITKL